MGRRPQLPLIIEDLVSESESASEDVNDRNDLLNLRDKELKIMKVLVKLFKSCTELSPQDRPTASEALRTLSPLEDIMHLTIESDDIIKTDDQLQAVEVLSDEQSCVEENSMDNCSIGKESNTLIEDDR